MRKKRFSAEQIIGKLKEAEVLLSLGSTVGEVSHRVEIMEQIRSKWRKTTGIKPLNIS